MVLCEREMKMRCPDINLSDDGGKGKRSWGMALGALGISVKSKSYVIVIGPLRPYKLYTHCTPY